MDFFWMNLECCRFAWVSQPQLIFLVLISLTYDFPPPDGMH